MSAPFSCGCCGGAPRFRCTGCGHVLADRALCQCYCPNARPVGVVAAPPKPRWVVLDIVREWRRAAHYLMHGVRIHWRLPLGHRIVRARRGRR
jgi:hypothetical protein